MPDFDQLTVGDETACAYVRIPDGARAGVVVLHAWWGLNEDVIAYVDRLAEAGFAVIAPDMFRGRDRDGTGGRRAALERRRCRYRGRRRVG